MSNDIEEDLAAELARRMIDDIDILYKNDGLRQRVVAACIDDGLVWSQILKLWRNLKCIKQWQPRVIMEARKLQGVPSIGAPDVRFSPVKDTWKDAPVSDDACVPPGWGYGDARCAIYKLVEKTVDNMPVQKRQPVSFDPIVITQRISQKENGEIFIELAWLSDGKWHRGLWSRDTLFSNRKIVDCSRQGLPVASHNAALISEYLHAYEHHNLRQIAEGYARGTMGWLGEDDSLWHHGFLVGNQQIGANGQSIIYSGECGDEFKQGGSFEKWQESICQGDPWPSLRVALIASLAAPLIGIVGSPNVIIEWIGDTSVGKSVALRFGRSAWCGAKAKLPTWNATVNGLEARAQCINDLPLYVDDTAQIPESKRRDVLGAAVYMLESGHTRLRATKELGQRPSRTWRTVVLSTGEYALADYVSTGGAAARVLSFYGPVLGPPSPATGAVARKMTNELGRNYGHAGPMFVKWLWENGERWDEFADEYNHIATKVREASALGIRAGDPSRAISSSMRLADTVALLQITAKLAVEAGILPWADWSPLSDHYLLAALQRALDQAADSSNKAKGAYHHVLSVAASRHRQWVVWGDVPPRDEPAGGWLGWRRLDPKILPKLDDGEDADLLAWHPSQLKAVLAAGGYPVDATLKSWRDAGILVTRHGRLSFTARYSGTDQVYSAYLVRMNKTDWSPRNDVGTDSDP